MTNKKPRDSRLISPESWVDQFDHFFNEPMWRSWSQSQIRGWIPRADVSETDKEITIKMNVPGVDPNKITVAIEDSTLIVSGSTEDETKTEGETWYRLERESGRFRRSFQLPSNVDAESIEAILQNGTIVITIAKKFDAHQKKIEVKVK